MHLEYFYSVLLQKIEQWGFLYLNLYESYFCRSAKDDFVSIVGKCQGMATSSLLLSVIIVIHTLLNGGVGLL